VIYPVPLPLGLLGPGVVAACMYRIIRILAGIPCALPPGIIPAGYIIEDLTEKVFEAVNSALEGSNVRIYVKGEEDLAVMPLVALLPNGSVILYGQPNEGVVRVDVNDERKVIILSMLERMEKHGKTLEKIRRWLNGGSR